MRNFGIRTSQQTLGGKRFAGSPIIAPSSERNSNSSDERELGACVFIAFFLSIPFAVLSVCWGAMELFK